MGTIPATDRLRPSVRISEFARHERGGAVRLAWLVILALGTAWTLASTSQTAVADGYVLPQVDRCAATSQFLISENGACFALNGTLGRPSYGDGRLGDIGMGSTSFSATGAMPAAIGKLGGALRIDEDPGTLELARNGLQDRSPSGDPPSATWSAPPVLPEIRHAYVDAGSSHALVRVGKVEASIADADDDTPFGGLDFFDSRAAIGAGVQTSDAPSLAGQSVQFVSAVGKDSAFGTAVEGLDNTATALASWNYSHKGGSGHLTVLDPDIAGESGEKLGLLAGATANAAFLKLRGALAGDRTGWLNGMVSTQAKLGALTVAASGEYLRNSLVGGDPQQFGGGLSASTSLDKALSVDGSLGWVRDDAEAGDPDSYQLGLGVTASLIENLKLTGRINLATAAGDGSASVPFGETRIDWTPANATAISLGFGRAEDGDYHLTTGMRNDFN